MRCVAKNERERPPPVALSGALLQPVRGQIGAPLVVRGVAPNVFAFRQAAHKKRRRRPASRQIELRINFVRVELSLGHRPPLAPLRQDTNVRNSDVLGLNSQREDARSHPAVAPASVATTLGGAGQPCVAGTVGCVAVELRNVSVIAAQKSRIAAEFQDDRRQRQDSLHL